MSAHHLLRPYTNGRNVIVPDPIIAHRGAPRLAPENTLPAIVAAANQGAKWVEIDVKLTKDQRPVIFHDDKVDRITNGTGYIAGMSFDDVRALDARGNFGPEFAGVQIPTLEELLETVLTLDLGLQLELKPTRGDDIETAEVSLNVLREMWPKGRERLFISSFSSRSIHAAARLLPDVPRAFAVVVPPKDPVALLKETNCQILHVTQALLTDDAVTILADSGVEFAVAVVNDPARARALLEMGAQSISTDVPTLIDE